MYIAAACLYPGGSAFDKQAEGFSIIHNYWCDLFDPVAHNGTANPSRPIAVMAMMILAVSMGLLWYFMPRVFNFKNKRQKIIQYAGIGSMAVSGFLFTNYHEEVINLGGLLGGLALAMTLAELYRTGKKFLFTAGVVCLILSGMNYFVYKTGLLLFILAGTQKITFLLFFVWAGLLNVDLYKKEKSLGKQINK